MRVARTALCLALTGSLLGAGVAGAATKPKPKPKPKPVCNLVTDDAGDASILGPDPSDDTFDILGADIASNAKTFTAVMRIKNLSASSPTSVTGRNYYLQITLPSFANPIYFSYEMDATGGVYKWGDLEPGQGGVASYTSKGDGTGTINTAKNEIHISVPVADIAALGKVTPGTKISAIHVNTTAVLGVLVTDVDSADNTKAYIAGALSCVTPGK